MKLSDFGHVMRKYRMAHGLTQEELAEKLDIQAKYVSFLENGHRNPSPTVQQKMENLLLEDEWGKALVNEGQIVTPEELSTLMTLYKKLCRVHPINRKKTLDLLYQILDSMTREN